MAPPDDALPRDDATPAPGDAAFVGALLADIAAMATNHVARRVFDLPEPRPLIVTEHRAHGCRCPACGQQTQAAFPEGVTAPVQYGKRLSTFVLYLLHHQLLPEKHLATLMSDLLGGRLVMATIARIRQDCAHLLTGCANMVRDHVAAHR